MVLQLGSGRGETQKYITISPVRRLEGKNGARLTEDFTWKIKIT